MNPTLRSTSIALLVSLALPASSFGQQETAAPAAVETSGENLADLFAASAPAATEAAAPSASVAEPQGFVLKLKGDHEFAYHQPTRGNPLSYDGEMRAPGFRNVLGLEARSGDLKLVSDWRFDLLLSGVGTSQSVQTGFDNGQRGAWEGPARVRPLDNYVSWSPEGSGLKLSAGYQTFAWGAADMVNPTDQLNPRDYTLGVMADDNKIPVLAVDLVWYPVDALSVEAVYVPFDRPYRWPVDYATSIQAAAGTSRPVTYEDLQFGPESAVGGGRIAWRGALDLSLSYLYDFDQYYVASVDGMLYSPLHDAAISLQRARVHRVGADAKGTLGSFGLWAEGAANLTEDSDDAVTQRHWWLDYVAGIDSSFGPGDKAYFNLQYLGSVVPDYDGAAFDLTQALDPRYGEAFYRRALAGNLGFQTARLWQGASLDLKAELFGGLVTPELRAVYLVPVGYDDSTVTQYGSLALNPEVDISPKDAFHILVGADLAYSWFAKAGSDETELNQTTDRVGEFTRFNNLYVKLAYQWNLEAKK